MATRYDSRMFTPFQPSARTVLLREAHTDDAGELSLLGAATFLEAFADMLPGPDIVSFCAQNHSAAAYEKYFAQPETAIALALLGAGEGPIGYAMLAAPELATIDGGVLPGDIELKRIYVFSRFFDTRAGQLLMDWAVSQARALGKGRLLLGTHAGNYRAIAFYRRNGFVEAGSRSFQVGTQTCCDLIFAKPLS